IVKAMVDAGHAEMILGNHEFSAIAYFTPVKKGFLRPHNLRSDEQIRETIAQFEGYAQEWLTYLQWFKTLPLFLEFDDFRVVHACWDYRLITEYQETYQSNALSVERILECEDQNSLVYRCIDRLTRGISLHLPDGLKMQGRDGYLRHSFRVNFWRENPVSYDDVHFQPDRLPEPLSQRLLTEAEKSQINHYAKHEKLLFIGHYWLEGKPAPVAENIACLDYSAVHNGQLVAYRFDVGDKVLSAQSYVSVCSSDLPRGTVNG
ncbi:MAG: serine/threonine protein phosphatase, partial [Pseudomonadales bacterium]|nr:serine/threonine protein phosphatase [Pseudomonadales bacterium]